MADPAVGPEPGTPWQAQLLALLAVLERAGVLSAQDIASARSKPAQELLAWAEAVLVERRFFDQADLERLRSAWAQAYRDTPHGEPVRPPHVDIR